MRPLLGDGAAQRWDSVEFCGISSSWLFPGNVGTWLIHGVTELWVSLWVSQCLEGEIREYSGMLVYPADAWCRNIPPGYSFLGKEGPSGKSLEIIKIQLDVIPGNVIQFQF